MRIQHNIPAMNALTHYTNNNKSLAGNLEKLSSGYRINSAADDAAGLAISEKMRSQIAGLEKAYDNTNDGISLVQTAEGALTEVNSMLTRLKTLATQSANGTYQEEVDREAIQTETNDILSEIDRISQATNFNGINLLDGSLDSSPVATVKGLTSTVTAATAGTYKMNVAPATSGLDAVASVATAGDQISVTFNYTVDGNAQQKTLAYTLKDASTKTFIDQDGKEFTLTGLTGAVVFSQMAKDLNNDENITDNFEISDASGQLTFTSTEKGENAAVFVGIDVTTNISGTVTHSGLQMNNTAAKASENIYDLGKANIWDGDADTIQNAVFEVNGKKFLFAENGTDFTDENVKKALADAGVGNNYVEVAAAGTIDGDNDVLAMADKIAKATGLDITQGGIGTDGAWAAGTASTDTALIMKSDAGKGLVLQIGDTNDSFQKVEVAIKDMSSKGIGIAGLDLSTQDAAGAAIDTIKNAVNAVSAQRGRLGALQNRLDHTLNNLDAMTENITSSEAQIRDTNMAKEMTAYTKNNILAQAAQSMLAQANSMPQGVLQLLQ